MPFFHPFRFFAKNLFFIVTAITFAVAFQLFTYKIRLYFAFGNKNGFLTEKGAKIFCNIVHNGFFNVNKSKHKTCFSGIFPVFINVSAFLYAERKRHLI